MVKVSKYFVLYLKNKLDAQVPFDEQELDQFYYKTKKKFVACDNRYGLCQTGTFSSMEKVEEFFLNNPNPMESFE